MNSEIGTMGWTCIACILTDYILTDYILTDYILTDYILTDYILTDYILTDYILTIHIMIFVSSLGWVLVPELLACVVYNEGSCIGGKYLA